MKQALILIDEINRKKQAIKKTNSQYLKNDYSKSIRDDVWELKTYCKYKGLDLKDVLTKLKR